MTNILTSHTSKQLLGACAGMAIAGLLYVGIDQTSNIKGLLVSTPTINVTPEYSINAKDADEAAVRRVAMRAQTVVATLAQEQQPSQPETPITALASSRRAARQFAVQLRDLSANAKTYENDPHVTVQQRDRLAIRAARTTASLHPGASQDLPSSGLGLNLLVLTTLAAAFVSSNTSWRRTLASMISRLRIG